MKNSDAVKVLMDYGLSGELAHQVIGELGEALVLEPETANISAHVVRVVPADSVM